VNCDVVNVLVDNWYRCIMEIVKLDWFLCDGLCDSNIEFWGVMWSNWLNDTIWVYFELNGTYLKNEERKISQVDHWIRLIA